MLIYLITEYRIQIPDKCSVIKNNLTNEIINHSIRYLSPGIKGSHLDKLRKAIYASVLCAIIFQF